MRETPIFVAQRQAVTAFRAALLDVLLLSSIIYNPLHAHLSSTSCSLLSPVLMTPYATSSGVNMLPGVLNIVCSRPPTSDQDKFTSFSFVALDTHICIGLGQLLWCVYCLLVYFAISSGCCCSYSYMLVLCDCVPEVLSLANTDGQELLTVHDLVQCTGLKSKFRSINQSTYLNGSRICNMRSRRDLHATAPHTTYKHIFTPYSQQAANLPSEAILTIQDLNTINQDEVSPQYEHRSKTNNTSPNHRYKEPKLAGLKTAFSSGSKVSRPKPHGGCNAVLLSIKILEIRIDQKQNSTTPQTPKTKATTLRQLRDR